MYISIWGYVKHISDSLSVVLERCFMNECLKPFVQDRLAMGCENHEQGFMEYHGGLAYFSFNFFV